MKIKTKRMQWKQKIRNMEISKSRAALSARSMYNAERKTKSNESKHKNASSSHLSTFSHNFAVFLFVLFSLSVYIGLFLPKIRLPYEQIRMLPPPHIIDFDWEFELRTMLWHTFWNYTLLSTVYADGEMQSRER